MGRAITGCCIFPSFPTAAEKCGKNYRETAPSYPGHQFPYLLPQEARGERRLTHSVLHGRTQIDGITILDAGYLIPFRAKAWLDLTNRKSSGENIDSKNIRKHKNDIFRLSVLLGQNSRINVTSGIYNDIQIFLHAMWKEDINTKQLGLSRTKDNILEVLSNTYLKSE
jgi:hypothetical protein